MEYTFLTIEIVLKELVNVHSSESIPPNHCSYGWCSACKIEHRLNQGNARTLAMDLMQILEESKRIDLNVDLSAADPRFSTDYLFGEARGQMFGVMECEDNRGRTVVLRAFSCQYNSAWNVPGWAPPLFNVQDYEEVMIPADIKIKTLGRKLETLSSDDTEFPLLKQHRKILSQTAMKELHALYELRNFRDETKPMIDCFTTVNGPPTGAGDCCTPKLLNQARSLNLHPKGVAEFYWGKANRSGTREHGHFYSSCSDKCLPILGFMLCGVDS